MSGIVQQQIHLTYGPQQPPPSGGDVVHNTATDNSGSVTSLQVTLACTAGNSLVVAVHWQDNTTVETVSTVACTGESNLTIQASSKVTDTGSGFNNCQLATLANITSSGTKTITVTMSGAIQYLHIKATQIPGADTADFVEAIGTGIGPNNISGQTTATASATSGEANSLIYFAAGSTYFGNSGTAGAGLTELSDNQAFAGWSWAGYQLDAGSAGAESRSVTFTDEDNWFAIILIMNKA